MAGLKWHLITPLVKRKSWLLKKITVCMKRKLWIMTSGFIPFEDKIIEKPYGVFIYTSYGCSTSCCLWNIMWFSLCETWRQREFALKKFHSHEIFAEENIASTASMFGLCVITLYQRPVIEKFRIFYQPWDIHLQYPSKFGLVWFGR